MSDIKLKCESCKGKRFKKPVLQVKYLGKNIDDVLNMTIENAYSFFQSNNQNKIATKLKCLIDVGMGYVNVGQSSSTRVLIVIRMCNSDTLMSSLRVSSA